MHEDGTYLEKIIALDQQVPTGFFGHGDIRVLPFYDIESLQEI
jgi:hypothetical protein